MSGKRKTWQLLEH